MPFADQIPGRQITAPIIIDPYIGDLLVSGYIGIQKYLGGFEHTVDLIHFLIHHA